MKRLEIGGELSCQVALNPVLQLDRPELCIKSRVDRLQKLVNPVKGILV